VLKFEALVLLKASDLVCSADMFFQQRLSTDNNHRRQNKTTYKTKRISDLKQDHFELSEL